MIQSQERNSGIDLLRGISILFVVIHHVAIRIPLKQSVLASFLPQWFLNGLQHNGYESVFIFFVISGFLITSNAFQRWGNLPAISLSAFYIRRASRILPCLLILVTVLSLFHELGFDDYVIFHSNQSLGRAIFSALGLHLNWYEGHTGYLPGGWDVLWSLSIEEVFYLGFPILCLMVRSEWALTSLLVLLALSLPFSHAALVGNEIWQEKAYLPGMSAIAVGVLSAIVAHRIPMKKRLTLNVILALGCSGILGVFFAEKSLWRLVKDGTILILAVSAALTVVAFYGKQAMGSMPPLRGTAWVQSFGRLSYEIYLTHMFVVYYVVRLFKQQGANLQWGFVWYIPVVLVSWLLGWAVARFISIPLEHSMRDYLIKRKPLFFRFSKLGIDRNSRSA